MCVLRTENISLGIRAGYTQSQGRQTESAVQRQARLRSREHTSAIPDTSVEDGTIISTKGGHTAIANTIIQHTRDPSHHKALSEILFVFGFPPPAPRRAADIAFSDAWLEKATLITTQGHTASAPHKIYRKRSGRLVSFPFYLRREQHVRILTYGYDNQ